MAKLGKPAPGNSVDEIRQRAEKHLEENPEPPKKEQAASPEPKEKVTGNKYGLDGYYFSPDRSEASIGGTAGVKEMFGHYPIPISGGLMQVKLLLSHLLTYQETYTEIAGLPDPIPTSTLKFKNGCNLLIIDSMSILATQTKLYAKRHDLLTGAPLKHPKKQLTINDWGWIGDEFDGFFEKLSELEATVIATAHLNYDKDDSQRMSVLPALSGKAATAILKYFDAVLFATTVIGEEGTEYLWITKQRPMYPAKIRGNLDIDATIPQDFNLIMPQLKEMTPYPKILIIGDSGSGKTTSLLTLK